MLARCRAACRGVSLLRASAPAGCAASAAILAAAGARPCSCAEGCSTSGHSGRSYAGHAAGQAAGGQQGRMLLRDFIQASLYHPELGYFSRATPPVGRLPAPIDFRRLVGQAEYCALLDRLYRQLQVDWLTPSEIFRPWYGAALADYMLEAARAAEGSAAGGGSGSIRGPAAAPLTPQQQQQLYPSGDSSVGPVGSGAGAVGGGVGAELAEPLAIVEVGGGTGSLAASILDRLRERAPAVYATTSYTVLEASCPLAQAQRRVVVEEAGHDSGIWRCVVGDAADPATWRAAADGAPAWQHKRYGQGLAGQHAFVLAMEVLDNLPHDRVVRPGPGQAWQQTLVVAGQAGGGGGGEGGTHGGGWREALAPADDPLLLRCIDLLLRDGQEPGDGGQAGSGAGARSWLQRLVDFAIDTSGPSIAFLPTHCLRLLDTLHAARPRHTLVAADFDALPDVTIPGRGAPLVSSRPTPSRVADHSTLLVPWGSADIFFPTDFDGLAALYREAGARAAAAPSSGGSGVAAGRALDAQHLATGDFLSRFAVSRAVRTLSGWSPMLQDWPNTRIFLGSSRPAAAAARRPGPGS